MSFPTKNRDVDREILKRMDDRAFLSVCTQVLNKEKDDYMDKLCNGDKYYPNLFELRLRTDPKYIGTYAYKPQDSSWRKYFASVIYWVEKLKDLGYDFTANRGNPKIYYDVLSKTGIKNKPSMSEISPAIRHGYLDLVIFLTRSYQIGDRIFLDYLLSIAFINNKFEIASYLISKGAVISADMVRDLLNNGSIEGIDFLLNTTEFDYARWFEYLRTALQQTKYVNQKMEPVYIKMIAHLNEKFKLTLPVLPKFNMKN